MRSTKLISTKKYYAKYAMLALAACTLTTAVLEEERSRCSSMKMKMLLARGNDEEIKVKVVEERGEVEERSSWNRSSSFRQVIGSSDNAFNRLFRSYCDGSPLSTSPPSTSSSSHYASSQSSIGWGQWLASYYNYLFSSSPPSFVSLATYAANDPLEDRMIAHEGARIGSTNLTIAGVLDGHGGWQVANFASNVLVQVLLKHLLLSSSQSEQGGGWFARSQKLDEIDVESSLLGAFAEIEKSYIDRVRKMFLDGIGSVAKVGSCAVVAVILDNLNGCPESNKHLVVANVGDCRAILCSLASDDNSSNIRSSKSISNSNSNSGSNSGSNALPTTTGVERIFATRLTRDHNCRELVEDLKLHHEHPGEPDVVYCKTSHACYVKRRLQLTRAFGDLYLKHREFNGQPGAKRSQARHIPDPYTPPYLSAVPDIHHAQIDPKTDKFLILASDGVWDFLSDQKAAEIAFECMKANVPREDIARKLVDAALEVAAEWEGISIDALKALPIGDKRRRVHDDTTVAIVYL